MKKSRLGRIAAATTGTIRRFPVETAIIVYTFIGGVLLIANVDIPHEANIGLTPLFFMLAYILNILTGLRRVKAPDGEEGKAAACGYLEERSRRYGLRWIYYLCWLPIVPLWMIDPSDWIGSTDYLVAFSVLAAGVLCCRRALCNERFAYEALNYLVNATLALVFSSVAFGLLSAIYASLVYIFGLGYNVIPDFYAYAALFTYCIACPLIFLTFVRGNVGKNPFPSRFFDILLNFILTPALVAYAAILYVYFIKIVIMWSLPEGGVAAMVFVFTIVAVAVKSCQPLLSRRYYDWFFDRFSLIALPAVIMFWVGTVYRISEYGFTPGRIYLVISGLVMTGTLAAFVRKSSGRYIYVTLSAMLLFALFTFVPPISAESISVRDQTSRFDKYAGKHRMLDADGRFKPEERLPVSDSLYADDYERIYSSLNFLYNRMDHTGKTYRDKRLSDEGFGMKPWEFRKLYPGPDNTRGVSYKHGYHYYSPDGGGGIDIRDYGRLENISYYRGGRKGDMFYFITNDTLYIAINGGEVEQPEEIHEEPGSPEVINVTQTADSLTVTEATLSPYLQPGDTIMTRAALSDIFTSMLGKTGTASGDVPDEKEFNGKAANFTYVAGDIMIVFSDLQVDTEDSVYRLSHVSVDYILVK